MATATDLGNSTNWQFITSLSASAVILSPGQNAPIGELTIPVLLDRPIIALRVESPSAKPTWYFAGNVLQQIAVGIVVGGRQDAIASRRKIWLNQLSLFFLPKLSTSYALVYIPPKWFLDTKISVWEYVGPAPVGTDGDNAAIIQQLEQIEQKINTLL